MPVIKIRCLGCSNDVYAVNCRYRCTACGFEGGWAEVASQDGPNQRRENEAKKEETYKQGSTGRDKLPRSQSSRDSYGIEELSESSGYVYIVQKAEQEVS